MAPPARSPVVAAVALAAAVGLVACAGQLAGVVRTQASQDFGCPEAQIEVRDQSSNNGVRDFTVTGCGRQDRYQAACGMVGGCVAYRPGDAAKYASVTGDGLAAGDAAGKPGEASGPVEEGVTTVVGESATPDEVGAGAAALASAMRGATPTASESAGAGVVAAASDPAERGATADEDGVSAPKVDSTVEPVADPTVEAAEVAKVEPSVAARVSTEERTVTLRNACTRRVMFYVGKMPGEGAGRYMTLGSTNMISPRLRVGDKVWLLDAQQAGLTSVAVASNTEEIEVTESCAVLKVR